MEHAPERAVIVDLANAWVRGATFEPQREIDPAILWSKTDRPRTHLIDDAASLRVDGHGTELTDALMEEPIESEYLRRPIAKVGRDAHAPT